MGETVKLKQGTVAYEVERLHLYLARTIIALIKGNKLSKAQVREIATYILATTKGVRRIVEVDMKARHLISRFPLLDHDHMALYKKGDS